MGGPAIADLLFGVESPSGKLPATFPRMVGQIPIYYNQKNTGKPPSPDNVVHIDDIDAQRAANFAGHDGISPRRAVTRRCSPLVMGFPMREFDYRRHSCQRARDWHGRERLTVSAELTNTGDVAAEEVVQLYVRDLVASVTRPVKELKGFRRVRLGAGRDA